MSVINRVIITLKKYKLRSYNFRLVLLLIITTSCGILAINSIEPSLTLRQILGLILSLFIMFVVSIIDYQFILKFYWLYYIGTVLMLIAVLLVGVEKKGAKRWINIGIQIQPSEFAKLALIIFTAKLLAMYKDRINTWKFLVVLAIFLMVPLALIVSEDLSTTVTIIMVLLSIIFCAGLDYKIIGITLAVVVPLFVAAFLYVTNPNQVLLQDYQRDRIMAFLEPEKYDAGSYQQEHSIKAIGSGQLTGKGINNDDPSSLKNNGYIAEGQTDFIFAVIGEDTGFVGCCGVIILLALIVMECLICAIRCKDFCGRLICCGVAAYIGFQSFFNIGVTTRLFPNTGLPLPFFSYGLTSLVTLFTSMGIVLNISLHRNVEKDDEIFAEDFRG